jgi:dolichol kinase
MWTAASFSFYMLQFMNKYFEGSIYVNYYLDGCAGIVGQLLATFLYPVVKIQWSFAISITITLIGAIFLLLFQQWYLSSNWIAPFVPEKSQYPEGSEDENNYYMGYCIPAVVFFTKTGVN